MTHAIAIAILPMPLKDLNLAFYEKRADSLGMSGCLIIT
jgi:hypothetical protein